MRSGVLLLLVLAALGAAPAFAYAAARPLETGVTDPIEARESGALELGLSRIHAAGARTVYMTLAWSTIAPVIRPPGFDAGNHLDPAYRWDYYDNRLRRYVANGLRPILVIHYAPTWAEGAGDGPRGTNRPDPQELGLFARAAATRYSGLSPTFPRVRLWQVWSEPNLPSNLNPQYDHGRPFAATHYRRMLESAASALRSVRADNVVIAGGLAPFSNSSTVAPLRFMRIVMCLSRTLQAICPTRASFDVWSHHPYTTGGPTHQAFLADDASLGDMPEVRRTLNAGIRYRRIASTRPVRLWVTEFSWDTKPPDPHGVPMRVHTYWVAEALYRMWKAGVSLVVWHQLRDNPTVGENLLQSGLYFRGSNWANDRPKPSLRAFRFPVVAFPRVRGLYVWGRTPAGRPGRVVVERRGSGSWRRLGVVRTNAVGIFSVTFRGAPKTGVVRARAVSPRDLSAAFPLKRIRDFYVQPFGCWRFPCTGPGPG